jgi:hypothetical protein
VKAFAYYLRDGIISLRLTVGLLILSMILVFVATLDQTNLGIWGIQQKWFRSFVVMQDVHGFVFPVFPGGYLLGGLLLTNLAAAHAYRFQLNWRKVGILLTHFGLILLLVGELLSGLWQEDFTLRLNTGETKSYAESLHSNELAIIDTTAAKYSTVVAIPDRMLERHLPIQNTQLPFQVVTKAYYPNSILQMRPQDGSRSLATTGLGLGVTAAPQPITYRQDEANLPSAYIELVAPDSSLGTYLVSIGLGAPQVFQYAGRTWNLSLRPKRIYRPFALTLLEFTHDRYVGTEIPKNFASRLRLNLADGKETRDVRISMNNPLRYDGLTFYQAGFENNDRTSILQVVQNPSWRIPYVACALMGAGLVLHFGFHLAGFLRKRRPIALV